MSTYRMVVSCNDDSEICKRCGTRSDWHSEFDGQCPDDDSPHLDSVAYEDADVNQLQRFLDKKEDATASNLPDWLNAERLRRNSTPANDFNPVAKMSSKQLSALSSEIHSELLRRFLDTKEV